MTLPWATLRADSGTVYGTAVQVVVIVKGEDVSVLPVAPRVSASWLVQPDFISS